MTQSNDQVRAVVREHYAKVAQSGGSVGCSPSCCGTSPQASLELGYSEQDLSAVPEGANLGLGCGNPQAIARLRTGEAVLDLGSGAGFDCFLAARQVGPAGRVIGVDMTAQMVEKARGNAAKLGATNVDFRLGEIEHLPLEDASIDVILSNCVVNLSPDKEQVFREAYRVLKPGGRLAISDVVAISELPEAIQERVEALAGCIAGAADVRTIESMLRAIGFVDVRVTVKSESREFIARCLPAAGAENFVASANIEAKRPTAGCCAPTCCAPDQEGNA